MLERLGARPVVGRHDQQRRVDLARADEHVADQPVVAGHVDEVDARSRRRARGGRTRRRSSSPAAAPRAAGPRRSRSAPGAASSCRGRCGRQSRRRRSSGPRATLRAIAPRQVRVLARVDRPQVERRPGRRSIRPMTGRLADAEPVDDPLRPRPGDRETERRQRLARQRAAADGRQRRDDPARRQARRRSAGARGARSSSTGAAIIRQTGISRLGPARPVQPERRGDGGERDLVGSHRPGQRIAPDPRDEVGPADDSPACGPPTSLSPLNVTRSAPAASRSRGHRLVGEAVAARCRAARREPRSSITIAPWRWAIAPARPASGVSVKPSWRKFDGWTRRTTRALPLASGRLEVRDPRPVRRPDLDQPRPGPPDDLRDPHAAADLDELAARHGHAAARARRGRPRARPPRRCCSSTSASSAPVSATRCSSACAESRAAAARSPRSSSRKQVGAGGRGGGLDRRRAATAPARGSCGRSRRSR